ncbi:hypothetical protein [Streptomyces sp. NPDC048845]|uniref:SCO4225 family membrane protein n=1 Tax=Streptomyces sp. NPDC048845 TaxID=3155390 RepID=UPI0034443F61
MNDNSRAARVFRTVVGNRASGVYLAVCFALLAWVAVDAALVQHQDASFAGVWPLFLTAPTSLLGLLLLPETGTGGYLAVVVVSALVNSTVLGLFVRSAGRRPARPPRTAH